MIETSQGNAIWHPDWIPVQKINGKTGKIQIKLKINSNNVDKYSGVIVFIC